MSCNKCEKKPSRIDDVRAIGNSKCGAVCGMPFRKVVIPVALGTDEADQAYAPENGAYKNALVEYEANGALYIYSSDGIFTKLTGKMGDQVLYNNTGNNTDGAMNQRATTASLTALESSITSQSTALAALEAKHTSDVAALNKRIDDAEIGGGEIDPAVITRLEEEISTKTDNSAFAEFQSTVNNTLTSYRQDIDGKASSATVSEGQQAMQATIDALSARIAELEKSIPVFT